MQASTISDVDPMTFTVTNNDPMLTHAWRHAGLKFWMLTGDKMTTAKEIATMCRLTNTGANTFTVSLLQQDSDYGSERSIIHCEANSSRQSLTDVEPTHDGTFEAQLRDACRDVTVFEEHMLAEQNSPEVFLLQMTCLHGCR